MAYLNTKDVYDLFENGVANLHVTDIDNLPRIETVPTVYAYAWYAKFDNGATIEDKKGIVFAEDICAVPSILDKLLCKHNEDSLTEVKIEKIDISIGDGFIIEDR